MKRKFFAPVMEHSEADVERLIAAGEVEEVFLTLEYWRFVGEWDRLSKAVVEHHEALPASCELYLAEYDEICQTPFSNDHIPIANTAICRSHIDSLTARNRYYFRGPHNPFHNTQKRRQQIKEFRKQAPERPTLWDVLYAQTLKVRSQRDFDRVLELCKPAISAGTKDIDECELSGIALIIVFNAAMACRNKPMIQKALGTLFQVDDLRADNDSAATFINLLAAYDHSIDCAENDKRGLGRTTAHLSRVYRHLCRNEDINQHLERLSEQLCHGQVRNPIHEIELSVYLSPLTYPHSARITEDDLCDLIRSEQGPIKGLDSTGKQLAALCHAIGGVASVGLGPGETNKDIRDLTESMDTYWAYRGLAYRILRSNSSHLVPKALKLLTEAYARPDWSPQTDDPFYLFAYGTEPFIPRIEETLKWGLRQGDKLAFNQASQDIILPVLAEIPSVDDEPTLEYSSEAKDLLMEYAQSDLLDPTPLQLENLYFSLSSMGLGVSALKVLDVWLARWAGEEEMREKLVYLLSSSAEEMLPPRQAIELLEAKRHLFPDEDLQERIEGAIEELQSEVARSAEADDHFMLFDPSTPAEQRTDLSQATPREILQLGATCAYLEAPAGQALLPFRLVDGPFSIDPQDWPPILRNLMQHGLLQIRKDSPKGAFELEDDGSLSWYPDQVDLAANVYVDGAAGANQPGILMSLPRLIRQQVLLMSANDLLSIWRSFVRSEAQEYFLRCLEYFELPSAPTKGDSEVFLSAPDYFSLEQLMNVIYNACRSAAGDQKAMHLSYNHARNRARSIVKGRMERALDAGWDIKPGFRGDLMPTPFLVEYFATVFLPLGETVYEQEKPNISAIEDALVKLRTEF